MKKARHRATVPAKALQPKRKALSCLARWSWPPLQSLVLVVWLRALRRAFRVPSCVRASNAADRATHVLVRSAAGFPAYQPHPHVLSNCCSFLRHLLRKLLNPKSCIEPQTAQSRPSFAQLERISFLRSYARFLEPCDCTMRWQTERSSAIHLLPDPFLWLPSGPKRPDAGMDWSCFARALGKRMIIARFTSFESFVPLFLGDRRVGLRFVSRSH